MTDLDSTRPERPSVNGGGSLPPWLQPTVDALKRLLELHEGWDSYGGRPVASAAATDALILLLETMEPETPAPVVVPTVRGGVQLEWHLAGLDLEIEVLGGGRYSLLLADRGEEREEVVERPHIEAVRTALGELTRRTSGARIPA